MVEDDKKKTFLERTEEAYTPVPQMNREQRRQLKKDKKKVVKTRREYNPQHRKLSKLEDIVSDDNELNSLEADLAEYEFAQDATYYSRAYFRIWISAGLTEETARRYLLPDADKTSLQAQSALEVDDLRLYASRGQLDNITRIQKRFVHYEDDEEKAILKDIQGQDLTVEEIFGEVLRARHESIELIRMQIDYLKDREEKQRLREAEIARKKAEDDELAWLIAQEEIGKPQVAESELPEAEERQIPVEEEPFGLSNWNIYWTDRFWSDNPNHLTKIDTTTEEAALGQIEKVGREQISVNVGSVVRALEFHLLDRDKIQRALATRNKYAPEEIRRWVKVKRGKDRIGILIDEGKPNTAVFFVGGRDVVYRGL